MQDRPREQPPSLLTLTEWIEAIPAQMRNVEQLMVAERARLCGGEPGALMPTDWLHLRDVVDSLRGLSVGRYFNAGVGSASRFRGGRRT